MSGGGFFLGERGWGWFVAEAVAAERVRLICGLLSAWPELFARAEGELCRRFGAVLRASEVMAFDFTDYYRAQMGGGLKRKFLAFARPVEPSALAEIKLWTNELEKCLAGGEYPAPRPINLDPGYVTPAKLVLATTKDNAHRVYLGQGIYAEVTLSYRKGKGWQAHAWTYPDYRTGAYQEFFEAVRCSASGAR